MHMDWLTLPEPDKNSTPAFHDVDGARAWLASQPLAQPIQTLTAIAGQVDAIVNAAHPPELALTLLDALRQVAVPLLDACESRFTRKALPLGEDDQRSFEICQHLWLHLGTAYLRQSLHLAPAEKLLPLQRAAIAFRQAAYVHFLAAQACPRQLDRLLFAVLDQAERHRLLRQPLADPDFPHFGEAHVAGHLAWAFLLRLIDPYHLSAAQLTIANRALSRWRELAAFQALPDDDPRAHSVDLQPLFGEALPEGIPRWLEVRRVERKIDSRIDALRVGESPELLKLGRELSGAACIRLLQDIANRLQAQLLQSSTEVGEIELAFGGADAYAIFTGRPLNPVGDLDVGGGTLAHQRMAMFGFDRISSMPTSVKRLNVPSEQWTMVDGRALRPQGRQGSRKQAPCLIASTRNGQACLGILVGLLRTADGALSAELRWYEEQIAAGRLARPASARAQAAHAVFLLQDGDCLSLILPPSVTVQSGSVLAVEELPWAHLSIGDVVERGIDFVRYAVTAA